MSAGLDRLLLALKQATGISPRKSGSGWRCACSVCLTRALKVAIAEGDDGRLLIFAFCGHTAGELLAGCGLTMADLFDRPDMRSMTPAERRALADAMRITKWRAALAVLVEEASVILIAANRLGDGMPLDVDDLNRVRVGALRVFDAREVLNHG